MTATCTILSALLRSTAQYPCYVVYFGGRISTRTRCFKTWLWGAADQILRWGDLSRLRILFLDDRVGQQLQNLALFRLLIKTWRNSTIDRPNWDDAFALVDDVLDRLVRER